MRSHDPSVGKVSLRFGANSSFGPKLGGPGTLVGVNRQRWKTPSIVAKSIHWRAYRRPDPTRMHTQHGRRPPPRTRRSSGSGRSPLPRSRDGSIRRDGERWRAEQCSRSSPRVTRQLRMGAIRVDARRPADEGAFPPVQERRQGAPSGRPFASTEGGFIGCWAR